MQGPPDPNHKRELRNGRKRRLAARKAARLVCTGPVEYDDVMLHYTPRTSDGLSVHWLTMIQAMGGLLDQRPDREHRRPLPTGP